MVPSIDLLRQGWDINELDFDAILQSFGKPLQGQQDMSVSPPVDQIPPSYAPYLQPTGHAMSQTQWDASIGVQYAPAFSGYFYPIGSGGGSMDDVLFGLDSTNSEDQWASPLSNSATY